MTSVPDLPHRVLKALLGAWALSACSTEETAAVEEHLTVCAPCADEALRLRDAVGLLHTDASLDLDPTLRSRVMDGCLGRRPARIPVPEWAAPYDAETARLDALLRDIGDSEWHAPVRLRWFEEEREVSRRTTVAGVIGHLMAVDGLLSAALGLDDPLGGGETPLDPTERTERYWSSTHRPPTRAVREPWRAQSHGLIRTASFAGRNVAEASVSYGAFALPLQDAALDRAFECWVRRGHRRRRRLPVRGPVGGPSAPDDRPGGPAASGRRGGTPPLRTGRTGEGPRHGRCAGPLGPSGDRGPRRGRLVRRAGLARRRRVARARGGAGGPGRGGVLAGSPRATSHRWKRRRARRATARPSATCCSRRPRSAYCRACRKAPDHGTALTRRSPYGGR